MLVEGADVKVASSGGDRDRDEFVTCTVSAVSVDDGRPSSNVGVGRSSEGEIATDRPAAAETATPPRVSAIWTTGTVTGLSGSRVETSMTAPLPSTIWRTETVWTTTTGSGATSSWRFSTMACSSAAGGGGGGEGERMEWPSLSRGR